LSDKIFALTQMNSGQRGTIAEIQGGYGMVSRLTAMGIIPGKRITKISSMVMRGPVTIEIDRARIAIGFGMASRILVETD
jgi:ferrous iron transport protein A